MLFRSQLMGLRWEHHLSLHPSGQPGPSLSSKSDLLKRQFSTRCGPASHCKLGSDPNSFLWPLRSRPCRDPLCLPCRRLERAGNPPPRRPGAAVFLPVQVAGPTSSNTGETPFPVGLISYLAKQVLKRTLLTLMYFSTGVTGRMRKRSGSSILGFGVAGSSSRLIS